MKLRKKGVNLIDTHFFEDALFGTILLTGILIQNTLDQVSEPNIQYHVSGVVVHVQFPANNSVCVHFTIKSRMD